MKIKILHPASLSVTLLFYSHISYIFGIVPSRFPAKVSEHIRYPFLAEGRQKTAACTDVALRWPRVRHGRPRRDAIIVAYLKLKRIVQARLKAPGIVLAELKKISNTISKSLKHP
jgi:hypothetical protein